MLADTPPLVTEAEFLAIDIRDGLRRELVDGEIVVTPSPVPHHQRASGRLYDVLRAWTHEHPPHEVFFAPLDIRFGPGRILEPDLAVFAALLPDTHPVAHLPVLVVEVLSPSTRSYDRLTKRMLYADAGVPEFWLVDPNGPIERYDGPGLTRRLVATDTLAAATLPDLSVDVRAITAR